MDDGLKLISTFLDAVALIMALVLMVSIIQRIDRKSFSNSALMGALFSGVLLMSMSDPIDLGSAGIFDMRGLLIGSAAALFGPIAGMITVAVGIAMRWHIGGNGMVPGFVGIFCAFGAGLLWRFTLKDAAVATWKKSVLLGFMITFQLMAIFAAPFAIWGSLFVQLFPYTLATNVLGSLLVNFLIRGELSFLSEAESSRVSAHTDHLTGLLNRRGLDVIYPELGVPKGHPRGRALLYFDIDRFKGINDGHGHAVGDRVLKAVADRISTNLRPDDIFARLGGDEFAIILNQIDENEAKRIAERCRMVISEGGYDNDGTVLPVSISVGAIWMLEHSDIDAILDQADQALYDAKLSGRNRVVFTSEMANGDAFGDAVPA